MTDGPEPLTDRCARDNVEPAVLSGRDAGGRAASDGGADGQVDVHDMPAPTPSEDDDDSWLPM